MGGVGGVTRCMGFGSVGLPMKEAVEGGPFTNSRNCPALELFQRLTRPQMWKHQKISRHV